MGRLTVEVAARADARTGEFVEAFARRVEAMPPGQCPVGMVLGQLQALSLIHISEPTRH